VTFIVFSLIFKCLLIIQLYILQFNGKIEKCSHYIIQQSILHNISMGNQNIINQCAILWSTVHNNFTYRWSTPNQLIVSESHRRYYTRQADQLWTHKVVYHPRKLSILFSPSVIRMELETFEYNRLKTTNWIISCFYF